VQGERLDCMILKVSSNLNDSMILFYDSVICSLITSICLNKINAANS